MSADSYVVLAALERRNLGTLIQEICTRRGVLLEELCGRSRLSSVSRARHELWWRIHNHPEREYSVCEIARLFRRDPTTVGYGISAHAQRSATQ